MAFCWSMAAGRKLIPTDCISSSASNCLASARFPQANAAAMNTTNPTVTSTLRCSSATRAHQLLSAPPERTTYQKRTHATAIPESSDRSCTRRWAAALLKSSNPTQHTSDVSDTASTSRPRQQTAQLIRSLLSRASDETGDLSSLPNTLSHSVLREPNGD